MDSKQEISDKDFRELLYSMSAWYDRHGYINMLKVLYRGLVTEPQKLYAATKVIELFELLRTSGHLSSTNPAVLYDTINVTRPFGLEPEIRILSTLSDIRTIDISTFTCNRQILIKVVQSLSDNDVKTFSRLYNCSQKDDAWELFVHLEQNKEFCEENMDDFMRNITTYLIIDSNKDPLGLRGTGDMDIARREAKKRKGGTGETPVEQKRLYPQQQLHKGGTDETPVEQKRLYPQQQLHQGISERNFMTLLTIVSNWFDEYECISMLKVLYRDHVPDNHLLSNVLRTRNVLNLLYTFGSLGPNDLTLLYDTIKVTKQFGLERLVKDEISSCPNIREIVISRFQPYRQELIELGMSLTQADVVKINGMYNTRLKKYEDVWCLFMDLETRMIICKAGMETFVGTLKKNGIQHVLLQGGTDETPVEQKRLYPQQQLHQGISERNFMTLLTIVSNWFDEYECISMLKVLYRDHVPDNHLLSNVLRTRNVLNLLYTFGSLGPNDLTLLYDTIKVTKQFGLERLVKDEISSCPNIREIVISRFQPYRQELIELGMSLTQADVVKINGMYNTRLKKYEDVWCLFMDLETRMIICKAGMETFVGTLKKNGIQHVLLQGNRDEETSRIIPLQSQDMIIRDYLLSQQQNLCRNANRFTPAIINSRYEVDIAHMFTDLELLEEYTRSTTLEEVLGMIKNTPACKVLIEGEGGIGKTTLLRYLAYNWATEESDEIFKDKIVFLINIRDIDKGEDILDVIVKQLELTDFNLTTNLPEDPKLIKKFVINHDDKIVLLMDGLDELRDGNKSPIKLFKNLKLKNSKVVLASRSVNIEEFIKESNIHVRVKGFSKENMKRYIKKHFNFFKVPALGDSLIEELQIDSRPGVNKHEEVYSMCKNPMLLLSISFLWQDKQELPANLPDLFERIFRCFLNQFNRQEGNDQKISKLKNAHEKYIHAMLILGKCMYESLKRNQLSINKSDLEGNEEMVALALNLGFVFQDAPLVHDDFETYFTAPHKLILESLVGFYLSKLIQTNELKNECSKDMKKLLNPFGSKEWKIITNCQYLDMAIRFTIGFLGADADRFLIHWITDNFSTFRSLITYSRYVEDVHRDVVENRLSGHMTRTDFELKSHIDDICNSLKMFIRLIAPIVKVIPNVIELLKIAQNVFITRIHDTVNMLKFLINLFRKEDKGRMLAHLLIVAYDMSLVLQAIPIICSDDVVEYVVAECQKLKLTYDILRYSLFESDKNVSITASFLAYILINAPRLVNLDICIGLTGDIMNTTIRECCKMDAKLQLRHINIIGNNLSTIDGSLLASLMAITPELKYLNMRDCSLTGKIMKDMIGEYSRRDVELKFDDFIISHNNLSTIDGFSLASLMAIKQECFVIDSCSLTGDHVNDAISELCRRNVKLELAHFAISDNNLSTMNSSSLVSLLNIAPKLHTIYMVDCSLPVGIIEDIRRVCSSRGLYLLLNSLDLKAWLTNPNKNP